MGRKNGNRQRQHQRDRRNNIIYQRRLYFPPSVTCPGRSVHDNCDDFPVNPCANCKDRWIADGDWNAAREWRPLEIAPAYVGKIPPPERARAPIVQQPEVA